MPVGIGMRLAFGYNYIEGSECYLETMRASVDRKDDRVALVLAGGGITGAVYEIGALRALNDLLVDRSVNDFDIYVGTSAGALVGALLANGLTPEEMVLSLEGEHPEIRSIAPRDTLSFNYGSLLQWSTRRLPRTLVAAWSHYLRHVGDMTFFDMLWSFSEALPSGLYDSLALERYVRYVIERGGQANQFDALAHDLYVVATNLDTGEREVFGPGRRGQVPVSQAVAASAAIPLLYTPVRIENEDYVDGSLRGTASLDLAVEHGAKLVICINPLVAYDNRRRPGGHLSDRGMQVIASQVSRVSAHAGLHYQIKQLRRAHRDVDFLLIEPRARDFEMFLYNIMRYSVRRTVARHGFESVTLSLAKAYPCYEEVFARHGLATSPQLLNEELAAIVESGYDSQVIRRVLESHRRMRRRRDTPERRLDQTLDDLESALSRMTANAG